MSRKTRAILPADSEVNDWVVIRLLGQGGYGDVYEVKKKGDDENFFAMKIESLTAQKQGLADELKFIHACQDSPMFAKIVEEGETETHRYFVMELLGPSISNMRRLLPERRYSMSTVLKMGIYMLRCIQAFHEHGFVHCDVKPGNFLLRHGGISPLVLIDFGLSKQFVDPETKKPRREARRCSFRGTAKYCSLFVDRRMDQCPRDDLISWVYSLVELVKGRLPWAHIQSREEDRDIKETISAKSLFSGMPREFSMMWQYVNGLSYSYSVEYGHLQCLLESAMKRVVAKNDDPFDWECIDQGVLQEACPDFQMPKAVEYLGCFPSVDLPKKGKNDQCNVA